MFTRLIVSLAKDCFPVPCHGHQCDLNSANNPHNSYQPEDAKNSEKGEVGQPGKYHFNHRVEDLRKRKSRLQLKGVEHIYDTFIGCNTVDQF